MLKIKILLLRDCSNYRHLIRLKVRYRLKYSKDIFRFSFYAFNIYPVPLSNEFWPYSGEEFGKNGWRKLKMRVFTVGIVLYRQWKPPIQYQFSTIISILSTQYLYWPNLCFNPAVLHACRMHAVLWQAGALNQLNSTQLLDQLQFQWDKM